MILVDVYLILEEQGFHNSGP